MIDAYIGLKMQEVTRFRMSHSSGRVRHVLQLLRRRETAGCLGAGNAGTGPTNAPASIPASGSIESRAAASSGRRRPIMRAAFWPGSAAGSMLRPHERASLVILLGSLLAASAALATTYVRVEKDGTKTYSDRPIARAASRSTSSRRRPTRRRRPSVAGQRSVRAKNRRCTSGEFPLRELHAHAARTTRPSRIRRP